MPPVVGEKYDEGIVGEFESVQGCEHRPDAVVRTLDHGGIGGVLVSFGRFFGLVLLLEFGLGLNRGMYRIMSQIEEEGLVLVGFDELACLDTQPVGQVFALFLVFKIRILVRTMVTASAGTPQDLPATFTSKPCVVGSSPKCHLPMVAVTYPDALRASPIVTNSSASSVVFLMGISLRCLEEPRSEFPTVYTPCLGRVLAGHQAGPTWSAVGGVGIGVHKDHAVFGQLVDVRTFVVFRSHVPKVGPTEVVDEERIRCLAWTHDSHRKASRRAGWRGRRE